MPPPPTHPPTVTQKEDSDRGSGGRRAADDAVVSAGGGHARRGRVDVVVAAVGGRRADGRWQRHGVPVHGPAVRAAVPRPGHAADGDVADAVPLLPAEAAGDRALPLGAAAVVDADAEVGVPPGRGVPRGGSDGETH